MTPSISVNLGQLATTDRVRGGLEEPEGKANGKEQTAQLGQIAVEDESMIPFRTSKRLQEVMYRMIQQRDGGSHNSNVAATKGKRTSPKRHKQSSPERIDAKEEMGEACQDEEPDSTRLTEVVQEVGCRYSKRSKRKSSTRPDSTHLTALVQEIRSRTKRQKTKSSNKVHFAEPLLTYIGIDKKKASMKFQKASGAGHGKQQQQLPTSSSTSTSPQISNAENARQGDEPAAVQPTSSSTDTIKQQRKQQPLSCLNLFCNHVGPRGWRCYRTRLEGNFFCSSHQVAMVSFHGGNRRTVCT